MILTAASVTARINSFPVTPSFATHCHVLEHTGQCRQLVSKRVLSLWTWRNQVDWY